MTQLYLCKADLTTLDVDAIVNSSNNDLILGSGFSSVIRRVGGPEIQEECTKVGTIPLGEAAVTTAGKLKCAWIIHVAVLPLGMWADAKSVRNGIRNTLKRAEEKKVKSLALPAVGTGDGALPIDRCAEILFKEIGDRIRGETSLEAVLFVIEDEKSYERFEDLYKSRFPESPVEAPPDRLPRAFPAEGGA